MESDEVEFQKMKPGVKNPEKLVIKDLKVLSRLIGIICNTHFSGECECKHDMNIIFRKRSREIARYSFCGHCIVLPHSERPLGDLGSSEYSLDLVNELYYSGQNKSE
ncbi:MAG: hypothetical protein HY606_12440 [Planctomycetes bacterium]|nr:hypothetical protein [Planctomycetota bacterium]